MLISLIQRIFDAEAFAKTVKAAGMKYAVLTAKHHDGFCMFNSKLTDYKLSKNFGGRPCSRISKCISG